MSLRRQQDVPNGFSNRSDGRPVSGVQPNSFRRPCRAAEKVSMGSVLLRGRKAFPYFLSMHLKARQPRHDVRDHRSRNRR